MKTRSYVVAVGGLNKWGSRVKHVGKVLFKSISICYKNKHCANVDLYPLKLALTSPTSGGCSVGIVRWRTEVSEFVYCFVLCANVEYWFRIFMIFRAANIKELGSGGSVCGLHSGSTWFDFPSRHRLHRLSIRAVSSVRWRECQCNALK
jgi:hypothetical protein